MLQSIAIAEQGGFGFGAKVVRGAYMDQEQEYTKELGREGGYKLHSKITMASDAVPFCTGTALVPTQNVCAALLR